MAVYQMYAGFNCLDPEDLQEFTVDQDLPRDYIDRANSYTCPLGSEPGEGWILLANADLREIEENEFHTLTFFDDDSEVVPISDLMILRAYSMAARANETDDQPMLVRLVDKRYLARMSVIGDDASAGIGQYNVRYHYANNADTSTSLYYAESLNAGSLWTWQTLLDNLWGKLPSGLTMGTAPTLPFTPDGNPEGFRFLGVSAWTAISQVLAKVSCAIRYEPVAGTFTYIRLGTTQSGLESALSTLNNRRQYDFHIADTAAARIPEKVRVFFNRSDLTWGVAQNIVRTGNVAMLPYYAIDHTTGASGAIAGTMLPLWDDLTAIYDEDGALTNSSALTARATEVATNLVDTLEDSEAPLRRHFNGFHSTIFPGAQVKSVTWRDYGDDLGSITEIHRHKGQGQATDGFSQLGRLAPVGFPDHGSAETLWPPDLARSTLFAHSPMMVKPDSAIPAVSGATPGNGTASIYKFDGTDWVDTTQNMTVYNAKAVLVNAAEFQSVKWIGGLPHVVTPINYVWHVTLLGSLADGASTSVTLGDGRSVSATNQSGATLGAGRATAYQDVTDGNYYLSGAGSGGGAPDPNIFSGTSVDTAVPGAVGTVTLADASTVEATNQGMISFFSSDSLTVFLESGNYYAIPSGTQVFPTTCPSPGVAAGATISITLPDGQSVTATNYARTKLFTGSKIHVYLDRSDAAWKIIRTDDIIRRRVQGLINMAAGLKGSDANATVDNIATLDGDSAPTITTAANTLKLWGADNDIVILEESQYIGGASSWFVAAIQPAARTPRKFKCLLNAALAKADANATIDTVTALDGGSAPSPTTAANYLRWAGANNDPCFIEEDWSSGTVAYILTAVAWDLITPVENVFTAATNLLKQTKHEIIGKANASTADSTIDTGTTC